MKLTCFILFAFSFSVINGQTSVDKTLASTQNGVDMIPVNVLPVNKDIIISTPEKKAIFVSSPDIKLQEISIIKDVNPITGNEEFLTRKIKPNTVISDTLKEVDLPPVEAIPINRY